MEHDIVIAKHFIKATREILRTMANLEPEVGAPFVKKDEAQEGDILAVIGVTGMRCGNIAVSFQRDAALALVTGMLGDAVEDLEKDMEDAVGEIANMVSGQARATLVKDGLTLQGSTPVIIIGKAHIAQYSSSSGVPIAIPFKLGGSSFTVEFCFDAA
jgi:chemotaxis protein CheX